MRFPSVRRWAVPVCGIVFCLMLAGACFGDPIVVTTNNNAMDLVNTILGAGVTSISNVTYTGASIASGTFTGGTGIFPFDSGIVLTTGIAGFIIGPNNNPAFTYNNPLGNQAPGDPDLTTIAGDPTLDASVLQFTFVPTFNRVSFQYVFGSEEYNEYVGSEFNDVFAFFLNGTNIALIPGAPPPDNRVSINNVNLNKNPSYYFNNTQQAGAPLNTQLDGLVGAPYPDNPLFYLYAMGSVTPGVPNTIKLAVADTSDRRLDSAVMIKAGSFTSVAAAEPPAGGDVIPEPGTWLLLGTGLGALLLLHRGRRTKA